MTIAAPVGDVPFLAFSFKGVITIARKPSRFHILSPSDFLLSMASPRLGLVAFLGLVPAWEEMNLLFVDIKNGRKNLL